MNIHLFGVTSSFSFSRYRRNLSALLKIQPFPTENKYAVVAKKTENMVWVNEESEEEESIEVEPGAGTDSANTQLPGAWSTKRAWSQKILWSRKGAWSRKRSRSIEKISMAWLKTIVYIVDVNDTRK